MELKDLYGASADKAAFSRRIGNLSAEYEKLAGKKPEAFFSSSGRAEICGNHTDHNHGKVLVAAISCDVLAAVGKTDDGTIRVQSAGFPPFALNVNDLAVNKSEYGKSVALVRGVVKGLKDRGYTVGGFTVVSESTIFRGAGVSSSAAFEVLIAEIVNVLYLGGRLPAIEKARAGMLAANDYFGKPCGLLDQAGIAFGGLNEIDFSPREPFVTPVPAPEGYRLILTNTGGSHAKLTAHYADIRREMGEVAAFFHKKYLFELQERDLLEALPALRQKVSDRAILRAFHFFEENKRVELAARALQEGDTSLLFRTGAFKRREQLEVSSKLLYPG